MLHPITIIAVGSGEPTYTCLVCRGWVRQAPNGVLYHVNPFKNDHPAVI